MGLNDRREQRRDARRERRAERRSGPDASERASERATRGLRVLSGGGGGDGDGISKPKLKKLRAALMIVGLGLLALVSWVFGIMMAVAQDLPALENRAQFGRAENSVILDRNGERLATLTNNEGRIIVASEEIAPVMKEAVVAIEDQRFYEHRGVDVRGIGRALVQDVLAGSAEQGASTITQQFVKNALAAQDDRTIFQKLREAALAYQLERNWSKEKILTEYLNSIYFGEGAYGIEAAARTFFGSAHPGCGEEGQATCASELLPYEAAVLAGIIASPTEYSPRDNPEAAGNRRDDVLTAMSEQGFITPEEYTTYAARELPAAADITPPADDSVAPYFTSWLRQQLVDRYGAGEAFGGGLEVTSTLDLELQEQVEGIADSRVGGVGLDTSIVVLDNETAGVLAMVGGSDYQKQPFNLATNGLRQPGSSFKPFTLVAALEEGRSTADVFNSAQIDIPFEVKLPRKGEKGTEAVPDLFEVNNYNDSYLGSVDLATATTFSDNSVYSQLGTQIGPDRVAATAEDLGIRTDLSAEYEYSVGGGDFEPYNPALILGGLTQGVTSLEMAHAYNTIEEDGDRITGTMAASKDGPVGILEVLDGPEEGADPVEDKTGASGVNESVREQVIAPETADTAAATLATVVTSGTGRRAQTGESTWGKTGTTDDNGDAWFCGATTDITTCVWVGHADSRESMLTEFGGAPVDGGTIPALIFADVVNAYVTINGSPEEPVTPEVPLEEAPVAPVEPEVPVEPVEPVAPVEPVEPVAPVPEEPVVPVEPEPDPAAEGGAVTGRQR